MTIRALLRRLRLADFLALLAILFLAALVPLAFMEAISMAGGPR